MLRRQLDRRPGSGPPASGRGSRKPSRSAGWPNVRPWGSPAREAGYPYSEQVQPWIGATIEKADEQRRLGEDRLFSSEEAAWALAQNSFAAAESCTSEAAADRRPWSAPRWRRATALLAGLPDYSRWLAHRHPDDLPGRPRRSFGELWTQAHKLAEQLESRAVTTRPPVLERARAVPPGSSESSSDSPTRPGDSPASACGRTRRPPPPPPPSRSPTARPDPPERDLGPPGHHPEARPGGGRQGRDRRALRGGPEAEPSRLLRRRAGSRDRWPWPPWASSGSTTRRSRTRTSSSRTAQHFLSPRTRMTKRPGPGGRSSPPPATRSACAGSRLAPEIDEPRPTRTAARRNFASLPGQAQEGRPPGAADRRRAPPPCPNRPPSRRPSTARRASTTCCSGWPIEAGTTTGTTRIRRPQALLPDRRLAIRRRRRQARREEPRAPEDPAAPRPERPAPPRRPSACSPSPASGART